MIPPERSTRKKKKPSPTTSNPSPMTSDPSLPNDLILSCLARVSRLYYPSLSLVSKSFRSLLASPELYKARSLLGHTESCLYVCLGGCTQDQWFTLCRKPDDNSNKKKKKKKKSSGYVLAKVPIPNSPDAEFPGLVAVGSNIYNISESSSSLSILDCRSHTWSEGPSMPVKLRSLFASVFDRKIYVAGRCKSGGTANSFKNSMQVFDTQTQIWNPEPIPCGEKNWELSDKPVCINGKLHVVTWRDQSVVAYDSKEGRWDLVEQGGMAHFMHSDFCCQIENVLFLYSVCDGAFRWYDTKLSKWRMLEGLVGLPKFPDTAHVRLADYGGKMAVLWNQICPVTPSCLHIVSCAVIELGRRKSGAIWGKVEWCDHVLRIDSYQVVKVLAATV